MAHVLWRENAAALLAEVGQELLAKNDRRVVVAMGTVLAYLEKAEADGDLQAGQLLAHLRRATHREHTERFLFAPGELEEIKRRNPTG